MVVSLSMFEKQLMQSHITPSDLLVWNSIALEWMMPSCTRSVPIDWGPAIKNASKILILCTLFRGVGVKEGPIKSLLRFFLEVPNP